MVFKLFKNLKNSEKGVTLVEIVVAVFIITMFSMMVIVGFPKIQKQYAFSRVTHKLAQDLRMVEDLGLSGVQINNGAMVPEPIETIKGYGIYFDLTNPTQYIIYADIYTEVVSRKYEPTSSPINCSDVRIANPQADCVIAVGKTNSENPDLKIKGLTNINGSFTSINFRPPNPTIDIDELSIDNLPPNNSRVGIVLEATFDGNIATRTIWVNSAGLINIE